MITRVLEKEDIDRITKLALSNQKYISNKHQLDVSTYHLSDLNYYFSKEKSRYLVGSFSDNQELLSTLGVSQWNHMPYATIQFLLISPQYRNWFRPDRNGFINCVDHAYEIGEKLGIHYYYFFRKAGSLTKSLPIWKRYSTERIKRYTSFVESFIPKNTKPRHNMYWNIMEKKTWPYDIEIRKVALKPTHFHELIRW